MADDFGRVMIALRMRPMTTEFLDARAVHRERDRLWLKGHGTLRSATFATFPLLPSAPVEQSNDSGAKTQLNSAST
jgi:hypothetical protein